MNIIRNFRSWWRLEDYEDAKISATESVVARLSRGNVLVQNGSILDEAERDKMSHNADEKLKRLNEMFAS